MSAEIRYCVPHSSTISALHGTALLKLLFLCKSYKGQHIDSPGTFLNVGVNCFLEESPKGHPMQDISAHP